MSEFLDGKKKLSLRTMRNLYKNWGTPLDSLIVQ